MSEKNFPISQENLEEIIKKYPTPFHIYDEKAIRQNIRRLFKAFAWAPDFREHYAVKAAPNPYLLQILREEGAERVGGVMHCFTESWEVAEQALALGFYISFSGIVTFKNARSLKEVARKVPLDRMLIETDSPYLAPVPHRGKTNEPGWVVHVAEEIARLRNEPLECVARASTDNFFRLFRHARA